MNANIAIQPYYPDIPLCNRAKLDTGKECNYNCYFCYYQGHLDEQDTYSDITSRADILYDLGIREIDLSGGESSIHKDWFKILNYCNKFDNISCLSNGSMFKDFAFLEKSKKYGLSEILFSIHGHNEEVHDKIVGKKGAFNDIMSSITNANKLGILVRINCTVTNTNIKDIEKYAYLINKLKPYQINFLPLNYWNAANAMKKQDYTTLSKGIQLAIDTIYPEIEINVRYIPFCYMIGYEKYVVNTQQHIYDKKDWNICAYSYQNLDKYKEISKSQMMRWYYKPIKCTSCKFFHICDGIEKKYEDIADKVLNPIIGKKVTNIMEYRQNI